MKEEGINDWLKFITSILTLLLPIAQVFSQNRIGLYIGGDSFFLISVIALVISVVITIAYLTSPYINLPLFWWQIKKYNEYIHKINPRLFTPEEIKTVEPVNQPISITSKNLAFWTVISLVVSSLLFIKIGLDIKSNIIEISNEIIIFQSFLYILTVVSATYILVYVTHSLVQRNKWTTNREKRAEKAIALAKKLDGFDG